MPVRLALFALALFAFPAVAAEKGGHGAHVHGAGRLNVAIEGDAVSIELSAPADDIVGFEHPATTPEDKAAVTKAVALLQDGPALFVFPAAAGCRLEEAKVETGLLAGAKSAAGDNHADFDADYRFRCTTPAKIDGIDVKFFARFPKARALDVQATTPKGQIKRKLTPKAARLKF